MRDQFRKYIKHSIQAILLTGISVYLSYHFIQGENGLFTWLKEARQIDLSSAELVKLVKKREDLEHRVALLRPEGLDPDILEERVREVLNYGAENNRVILKSNQHTEK